MLMSPEVFYAHAMRAADAEGRLPLARMTGWEVFPFEPCTLRVVPLAPPQLPEPDRHGEHGADCQACGRASDPMWSNGRWRLSVSRGTGDPQRDRAADDGGRRSAAGGVLHIRRNRAPCGMRGFHNQTLVVLSVS
jgi:hypothetical protein